MTGVIKYILLIVFQPHFIQLIYYLFMNRIEFIGFSCVGKSTLMERVLKKRNSKARWMTPDEGRILYLKKKGLSTPFFSRRMLIKLGYFFKNMHSQWALELVDNYKSEAMHFAGGCYDGLIDLHLSALCNNKEIPALKRLESAKIYFQKVINDIILLDYMYKDDKLFVMDEGLITINSGIYDLAIYNSSFDKESVNKVNPVGIVFCQLGLEDNYARMKNRIKEGQGNYLIRYMSDNQLKQLCKQGLESSNRIAITMKEAGVKVLEIDMASNLNQNAETVCSFINEIEKNYS